MSNPITTRNPYFATPQQRPNNYGEQQRVQYETGYAEQYAPSTYFEQQAPRTDMFAQADPSRMTYTDAMNKVAILLGTALLCGVATVILLPAQLWYPAASVTVIAAVVVGLILAFQRMVSPVLAMMYAVLEGVALGAITGALNQIIPGIALQAILATAIIVGVTLALHYSGTIRTTTKGRKMVLVIGMGYFFFCIANMLLSAFGVFKNQAWGVRSYEIMGMPLGVVIGAAMILVAAYMLIADFEDVNIAIANGAPKKFSWTCGIAIVMTIIWIYVEVLRIIAILNSRN
ncbi:Bax inhibitor-1/YccA family protein [Trueperella sp. LYQ143]|uniref:Bax inhibitor-1/YccA family protein n=1 Tax=unclassified Trueperella TaxID=2630174 RepID=UPI00398309FD